MIRRGEEIWLYTAGERILYPNSRKNTEVSRARREDDLHRGGEREEEPQWATEKGEGRALFV